MKKELEEVKNLDEFLSDIAEVFEVSKRRLKRMVFQFDEEPETIKKNKPPRNAQTSSNLRSTPTA